MKRKYHLLYFSLLFHYNIDFSCTNKDSQLRREEHLHPSTTQGKASQMKKILSIVASIILIDGLLSSMDPNISIFGKLQALGNHPSSADRKTVVSFYNQSKFLSSQKSAQKAKTHSRSQKPNIPTSGIVNLNRSLMSATMSNCCIIRDRIYYFNSTKNVISGTQSMGSTGRFFTFPGDESLWQRAVHISGSTIILIGNSKGNNNLQHMWFIRQFPTLARAMQQHLTGDPTPYFENMIVDGSTYTHGPVEWHRGLNQIIVDLINARNKERGEPQLKVYEADEKQPVCFKTATIQGNGNDMRRVVIGGREPTLDILQKLRQTIYSKYKVPNPTPKRCPRKAVVYAKFDSGHKRWLDAGDFYKSFKQTYPDFDVDYWPFFPKMTFEQQVRLFSNLDLLISSDGAHQMPVLFMSVGSAAVEILDGSRWFKPWNLVYGLHDLVNVHFLALKGENITTQVYDKYMKDFDPQDLQVHKHMAGAHTVDIPNALQKIGELIKNMRKDCVIVPKDRY